MRFSRGDFWRGKNGGGCPDDRARDPFERAGAAGEPRERGAMPRARGGIPRGALARTGEMEEAIARLEQAVALDSAADHANALGAALAQAGRLDEALKWLRRALADDPAHEEARANLAQAGESALRRGVERGVDLLNVLADA